MSVLPVLSINGASWKGTWAEGWDLWDHWGQWSEQRPEGRSGGYPGGDEGTCALMPCRSLTGKIHPLERVIIRGGYLNLTCLRGWDLMSHFQGFCGFPPNTASRSMLLQTECCNSKHGSISVWVQHSGMGGGKQDNEPRREKPGVGISRKRAQVLPGHFDPSSWIIFWMICHVYMRTKWVSSQHGHLESFLNPFQSFINICNYSQLQCTWPSVLVSPG